MTNSFHNHRIVSVLTLSVMVILLLTSCKKTYFSIKEEINDNIPVRFTTRKSHYRMGQSIALTHGKFRIVPGDSIVMYIEGQASIGSVGEAGVASLEAQETARFYVMLPTRIEVGEYNISRRAICEIIGRYNPGEELFICQSGRVVVDSLKRNKIYGVITGEYLNTSNLSLSVEGNIKAKPK